MLIELVKTIKKLKDTKCQNLSKGSKMAFEVRALPPIVGQYECMRVNGKQKKSGGFSAPLTAPLAAAPFLPFNRNVLWAVRRALKPPDFFLLSIDSHTFLLPTSGR